MSVKYGFKVCRVCLAPEPAVILQSMFESRGEIADWFQLVSGCSISYDRGKHEALICPKCSEDVKAAFNLRENIRRVDAYYFQSHREEATEEFEREQTAVEDTPAETAFHEEPSCGLSRMPSQVQSGVTRLESKDTKLEPLATAVKMNQGKLWKCHVCDKNYSSKRNLHRHIKVIHEKIEKIRKFACDFCPTKTSDKRDLHRHIARIHMSAESCPQLKCDFKGCAKSFRTSFNLHQHKTTHSNERPHICSTCQKPFKYIRSLKEHQKYNCRSKA